MNKNLQDALDALAVTVSSLALAQADFDALTAQNAALDARLKTFTNTVRLFSTVPVRSSLYAGSTTRVIGHCMPWFGNGVHTVDPNRMPPYHSDDPVAMKAQSLTWQSQGFQVLMVDWYGPNRFEDTCTQVLSDVAVQNLMLCFDGGGYHDLAGLRAMMAYARTHYFASNRYERSGGKYLVSHFAKEGTDPSWFRTLEAENPDVLFIYNGETFGPGKSQMNWIGSTLEVGVDSFCSRYSSRHGDGQVYTPAFFAGFDDTWMDHSVWDQSKPPRVWPPGVGPNAQTYAATFQKINSHYSTVNQLPYVMGVTLNDWDELTSLERGIVVHG